MGRPGIMSTVKTVLAGTIAHETVHTIQARENQTAYDGAVAAMAKFKKLPEEERRGPNYLAGYLRGVWGEQEAHATGAAAEVWFSGNVGLTREEFLATLEDTEVFTRIGERTCGADEADMDAWVTEAKEIAWAAYQGWQ